MKLAPLLPIATAFVERAFYAMKIVKTPLCNYIGNDWFNDHLITYVKVKVLKTIENEDIMHKISEYETPQEFYKLFFNII